jgi:hypothetical protein
VTSKPQKGCSGAPESDSAPYGRGCGTGAEARSIRVAMPDELPVLNPGAARVLLRILLKARVRSAGQEEKR